MINADQILPPPHSVSVKPRVPDRPINGIHSPATRSAVAAAKTAEPSAPSPWTEDPVLEGKNEATPISQGSLHPEQVEPLASLGTKVGILLALPLSPSHGQGFGQWTTAGDFEQASQLGFGHRSAVPARVGLLIRLRHPPEWIRDHPADGWVVRTNYRTRSWRRGERSGIEPSGRPAFRCRAIAPGLLDRVPRSERSRNLR